MYNKQQDTYILLKKASEGDLQAKEKLIEDNMGLVYTVAKKFISRGVDFEDLVQLGCIGLINAVDKFDVSFNVMFSTYAVPLIMGEIKRFLRDDGPIKVSRSYRVISSRVYMFKEKFLLEEGREPTINEIAENLNIEREEIAAALEATQPPESIYKTVDDSEKTHLIDRICGGVDHEEMLIDKITISELFKTLLPRERKIIILRYFKDKKQTEVAKILGISQVQVSRLEKKILCKIKEKIS
ncbi:MAG: SigB/SigF/SigG family RNA polymerase sigma factor [Ruminococcaceae bacterium]|nr:SigB/SigF/SigG family RNA polymerase sigma factor [Oscillospiraceae bacterium]